MKTSREAGAGIHKSDIKEVVWEFYPLIHKAYYYYGNILIKKIESNSI
jgi:hypothetical protein